MGKFRSKLKRRSKGKQWAHGQSATSNPENKKHRNKARSRFFQPNLSLGESRLLLDAEDGKQREAFAIIRLTTSRSFLNRSSSHKCSPNTERISSVDIGIDHKARCTFIVCRWRRENGHGRCRTNRERHRDEFAIV